jgi:hypothetical protein
MGVLQSIKDFGLIKVIDVKNTHENYYVQFLDYVYIRPGIDFSLDSDGTQTGIDKDVLVSSGLLSDEPINLEAEREQQFEELNSSIVSGETQYFDSGSITQMSLVLNKVLVEFEERKVDIDESLDPAHAVYNFLVKSIVDKIRTLAATNKEEFLEKNVLLRASADLIIKKEMPVAEVRLALLSKAIAAAKMILVRTRMGPGNFIMANRNILDMLNFGYSTDVYMYPEGVSDGTIHGLKKFVCDDLGSTVIVGRNGNDDEPGIRLISNDDEIENNIYFNNTDIAGTKIRYALGSFNKNDKYNYISFDLIVE